MWIVHSAGVALGLLALYAYWADQAGPEFGWRAAAWMTAPAPLGAGVVWLMFFEEPLHIAALCGSLFLYNRRRFGLVALALAAAVASKPFGVLMLALLVIDMALKRARWRDVAALALLPAAVWLGWQLWVYAQTRAFLLPYTIQSATWARYAGFQILLENLGKGLRLEPFILVYSNVVFTQTIPFATVGLAYLFALARRRVVAWYWWPFTAVSVWLTLYYTPREAARIVIPTLFPLIPLFLLGRDPAGPVKRLERAVWLAMWAGQLALASAGVNYQLNGTRVGFWP
ncbi:MAG: hypothetical protein M5R40_04750 [Anaerolineae bacterium]|nr:hypothetical protein [Anaerolineae bacterium]